LSLIRLKFRVVQIYLLTNKYHQGTNSFTCFITSTCCRFGEKSSQKNK